MNDTLETRIRSDSSDVAFRKIFIGGLSYSTDEEKLKKYFRAYGPVQDAVVMKDPVSKRSRGFGFITFCDEGSVDIALAHEPHTLDSRKVEAKRAVPRSEIAKEMANNGQKLSGSPTHALPSPVSSPTTPTADVKHLSSMYAVNSHLSALGQLQLDSRGAMDAKINMEEFAYNKIFVGGLHYDTRDAEFRAYFEKYGKVLSAEVMFNRETHKSRGFGFIVFVQEQSAIRVCADKEHVIDGKVVEVKRAIPRSKISAGMSTPSSLASKSLTGSPASNTTLNASNALASLRRAQTAANTPTMKDLTVINNALTLQQQQNAAMANNAALRKAYANAIGPPPAQASRNSISAPSYAAALKGASLDAYDSLGMERSLGPIGGPSLASISHDSMGGYTSGSATTPAGASGLDLQTLIYTQMPSADQVRAFRSFSEPIVKTESSLDSVPVEVNYFRQTTGAIRQPPSASSSRSSSILMQQSVTSSLTNTGGGGTRHSSILSTGSFSPETSPNPYSSGGQPTINSIAKTSASANSGMLSGLSWLSSPPNNALDAALDICPGPLSLPLNTSDTNLSNLTGAVHRHSFGGLSSNPGSSLSQSALNSLNNGSNPTLDQFFGVSLGATSMQTMQQQTFAPSVNSAHSGASTFDLSNPNQGIPRAFSGSTPASRNGSIYGERDGYLSSGGSQSGQQDVWAAMVQSAQQQRAMGDSMFQQRPYHQGDNPQLSYMQQQQPFQQQQQQQQQSNPYAAAAERQYAQHQQHQAQQSFGMHPFPNKSLNGLSQHMQQQQYGARAGFGEFSETDEMYFLHELAPQQQQQMQQQDDGKNFVPHWMAPPGAANMSRF